MYFPIYDVELTKANKKKKKPNNQQFYKNDRLMRQKSTWVRIEQLNPYPNTQFDM